MLQSLTKPALHVAKQIFCDTGFAALSHAPPTRDIPHARRQLTCYSSTMAKTISKGGKSVGKWVKRDSRTGQFILGRQAFGSISSVEGIKLSRSMSEDLTRTESMTASRRRTELAAKYGKK